MTPRGGRRGADREAASLLPALVRAAGSVRRRAVLAVAAALAAAVGAVVCAVSLLPQALATGRGSPVPTAAALLLAAAAAGALWAAARAARGLAPSALADEADGDAGLGEGDVRGALELPSEGGGLARLHRRRVSDALAATPPRRLLGRSRSRWGRALRRAGASAALVAGVFAVLLAGRPERTKAAAAALAAPWRVTFPPPAPALSVSPGDASVPRGSPLDVTVVAGERARVTLHWRVAGEADRRRTLAVGPDGRAGGRTPPVRAPFRYWVTAPDGAVSDTFRAEPLDPLLVQDLRVRVRFPPWLGREPEVHVQPVPPLVVPEGARVAVEGRATLPVARAALRPSGDGEAVELAVDGPAFRGSFRPRSSRTWTWALRAVADGGADPGVVAPEPLRVAVEADRPPTVRILHPEADAAASTEGLAALGAEVSDDVALADARLLAWRATAGGGRAGPDARPLAEEVVGRRRVLLRPRLDLREAGLLPGDTALVVVEARDGNPGHAPVVSDTVRIRFPSLEETRAAAATGAAEASDRARRLEERAASLGRAAGEASRRASAEGRPGAGREAGFERGAEGRRLLADGEALGRELDALAAEVERLRRALGNAPATDPEAADRLARLEALRDGLRDPALDGALRDLREALRELDPAGLEAAVSDLARRTEEMRRRLERDRGVLERTELASRVEEARAQAEAMAEGQRQAAASERDSGWAARERGLAERTERLSATLDSLAGRLDESGAPGTADSVGAARERASAAAGAMRRAAEGREGPTGDAGDPRAEADAAGDSAAAGAMAGAGGPGRDSAAAGPPPSSGAGEPGSATPGSDAATEAAGEMSRAASALSGAAERASAEWRERAAAAVSGARREAGQMASRQAELAGELGGPGAAAPGGLAEWRDRQAALTRGMERLVESISAAEGLTPLLDPRAGEAADRLVERMRRMLEFGGGSGADGPARGGSRPFPAAADALAEDLNDLSLALLDGERAIRASGARSTSSSAMARMASLAERQEGLARRTGGLAAGAVPRGPQDDAVRDLTRRQREVAEELRRLEREGARRGRPGEMARDAEAVAERLSRGGPDAETAERQRDLFRRMLDAGRALEGDDVDTERRESRTAAPAPAPEVPALDPNLLRGAWYPHPDEAALRRLPPAYRALILDYFDRLNERGADGAAPGERP